MRSLSDSKHKRLAAGIMVLMVLIVVLFSAFCIAEEVHHDCSGEDCPVCASIRQCQQIIRGYEGGAVRQILCILPVFFFLAMVCSVVSLIAQISPIEQKVRLNN